MTINDKIREENLQYNINREAAKILALPWGGIDKHESFTGEDILPSDQSRIIEQTKTTYYPLDKAFANKQKQLKVKE